MITLPIVGLQERKWIADMLRMPIVILESKLAGKKVFGTQD